MKNKWKKIEMLYPMTAFAPGFKGVCQHAWAWFRGRQPPYFVHDMKLTFHLRSNADKVIVDTTGYQLEAPSSVNQ